VVEIAEQRARGAEDPHLVADAAVGVASLRHAREARAESG
jgi:hypothetical protein